MVEFLEHPYFLFSLLCVLIIYFFASSIRIANENERFAVFVLGRFANFRGPGLFIKTGVMRFVRLAVGDIATLTSREFANFGGHEIPVKNTGTLALDRPVRIETFDDDGPVLVPTTERPKTCCPKCGHAF